jgi:cytochrome c-type biogenesis protein CcmH/NrfG
MQTKLERRLAELQRLRDAGTISDEERTRARQRAIDAAAAVPEARGFRFGFTLVAGALAALVLAVVLFAACSFVFVRRAGETCSLNGTPVACENFTTPVPALPE